MGGAGGCAGFEDVMLLVDRANRKLVAVMQRQDEEEVHERPADQELDRGQQRSIGMRTLFISNVKEK